MVVIVMKICKTCHADSKHGELPILLQHYSKSLRIKIKNHLVHLNNWFCIQIFEILPKAPNPEVPHPFFQQLFKPHPQIRPNALGFI